MTVIVTLAVTEPPEFEAETVYTVSGETTVEVPEISPVAESMFNPFGSAGDIAQDVTAPPLVVGLAVGDIATSLVRVNIDGE